MSIRIRYIVVTLVLGACAVSCGSTTAQEPTATTQMPSGPTTTLSRSAPTSAATPTSITAPTTSIALSGIEAMVGVPALPITGEWVFEQPVWGHRSLGDDRVVMGYQGGIKVFNVDSGTVTETLLVSPELQRFEAFVITTHGDGYVAVAGDERGNGTVEHVFTVDTVDQRVTGNLPGALSFGVGDDPSRVIINGSEWDLDTMESGAEVPMGSSISRSQVGSELWSLQGDGTIEVHDAGSYEELESFQLDTTFSFLTSFIIGHSEAHVLIRVTDGKLLVVDRATKKAKAIDFGIVGSQFGDNTSISRINGASGGSYGPGDEFLVTLRAQQDDTSRWFLGTINVEAAELTALHTISDAGFEFGWTLFEQPNVMRVGERLFVADHIRRIVEVDLDRLGAASEPWEASGLSFLPELTTEESQVADVLRALLDGESEDSELVGFTDDSRADALREALDSKLGESSWDVIDVTIEGDRAWSRARPPGGIGYAFAFLQVDGEWIVNVESVCSQLGWEGSPC